MGFRASTSMLTNHFKQHCKTNVKPTIFDLGHALNPPRRAQNAQDSRASLGGLLGAPWGFMLVILEPFGGLVGASRRLMGMQICI